VGAADRELVEGYCDRRSYEPGERVALHLSVTRPGFLGDVVPGDTAHEVDVTITRIGADRREVESKRAVPIAAHPIGERASALGVDWPVAVEFEVTADWNPGWYEVELATTDVQDEPRTAHAGFVVRAPTGEARSPMLLVLSTNTWNAYNDWGGPNLYTGETQVSFARPWARGYVHRPDAFVHRNANDHPVPDPGTERWTRYILDTRVSPWSGCAGWPSWEQLFVEWAERNGYLFDFAANEDLAEVPGVVDGHRLLLSIGHDEYWSWGMRDTVEAHVDRGGHVAFFSGNTAFWQVRVDDDGRTMVCHKLLDDPLPTDVPPERRTSMWSDPRIGRPETQMTGVSFTRGGYARIGQGVPRGAGGYTIWQPTHWLFAGTDLRYGDVLGAEHTVVGYECDGCAMALQDGVPRPTHEDGCPDGFEILATAPAHLWSKGPDHDEYPPGLTALRDIGELQETAQVLFGDASPTGTDRITNGHAVLGTYDRNGTVVTTGCTDWSFGLAGGDPLVEQITHNVLARLGTAG
jgi:hypothetical protein